jgi:hypothetical protein
MFYQLQVLLGSNDIFSVNKELESIWKKPVVACLKHLPTTYLDSRVRKQNKNKEYIVR